MSKNVKQLETITVDPARVFVDAAIRTRGTAPRSEDVQKMAERIENEGQLQAIGVRPYDGTDGDNFDYTLIFGEHRLEACKALGKEVRAEVHEIDEADAVGLAFAENEGRKETTAMDRLNTAKLLKEKRKLNNKEVARAMGLDNAEITRIMKLDKLPDEVKTLITSGDINMAQANALCEVPDESKQKQYAKAGWPAWKILEAARKEKPQPVEKPASDSGNPGEAVAQPVDASVKQRTLAQLKEVLHKVVDDKDFDAEAMVPIGEICQRLTEYIAGKGDWGVADVFLDIIEKAKAKTAKKRGNK